MAADPDFLLRLNAETGRLLHSNSSARAVRSASGRWW
jgi:hypothetical protein